MVNHPADPASFFDEYNEHGMDPNEDDNILAIHEDHPLRYEWQFRHYEWSPAEYPITLQSRHLTTEEEFMVFRDHDPAPPCTLSMNQEYVLFNEVAEVPPDNTRAGRLIFALETTNPDYCNLVNSLWKRLTTILVTDSVFSDDIMDWICLLVVSVKEDSRPTLISVRVKDYTQFEKISVLGLGLKSLMQYEGDVVFQRIHNKETLYLF